MQYYTSKEKSYFSNIRHDMIAYLPNSKEIRLLDIGCSGGDTICFLKENNLIQEGTGVELFELSNSNQTNPLIDKIIIGDIQQKNIDIPFNYYNVIFCGDVLEHLTDPWDVLNYLKQFLTNDGVIIASIPNIREIKTSFQIFIKGDFKYEKSGILDKTHLRFFCKKNIVQLFKDVNFDVLNIQPSFKTCPLQIGRRKKSTITLGIFDEFIAQQYIVTARKKGNE
jgi:2-polyprenyl-3-methyl-5-hydroxy-6-metoxy-1,4-benzoquinol methylase